jgi:hypothetical protein
LRKQPRGGRNPGAGRRRTAEIAQRAFEMTAVGENAAGADPSHGGFFATGLKVRGIAKLAGKW